MTQSTQKPTPNNEFKSVNRAIEFKAVDEKGAFEGYVSVYGNVDYDNDVIEKGAFEEVKTTPDGKLRIAAYHDYKMFVGKADFKETDNGLFLKGQLNMALSYANDVYELMKDGIISEMSVGFNVIRGGQEFKEQDDGSYVRHITKARLWEGSLVPFAANPEALITAVKSADDINTIRDFEQFLRYAGFSKRKAAAIASHGFDFDGGEHQKSAGEMLDTANQLSKLLKSGI